MFYGVGDTWVKTKNLTSNTASGAIAQEVIIPLYLFDFEYTEDSTSLEAKGQIKGVKKTLASAVGEVTSTVKLSTQFINWSQLGFFLNQFSGSQASVAIPVLKSGKVPASSPYEVVDTGIASGTASGIYVYVSDDDNSSYRTITSGTVAAGQVKVDTTGNKLVFHSSDAGKSFVYTLPTTYTNKETYGGEGGIDKYGTIEFRGTLYGTEDRIYFPSLDIKTSPSLSFTGDVATLEVEFSANTTGSNLYPYTIYRK
jgi:hypothetical protein